MDWSLQVFSPFSPVLPAGMLTSYNSVSPLVLLNVCACVCVFCVRSPTQFLPTTTHDYPLRCLRCSRAVCVCGCVYKRVHLYLPVICRGSFTCHPSSQRLCTVELSGALNCRRHCYTLHCLFNVVGLSN